MDLSARVALSLVALGIDDAPLGVACSGGADSVALTHLLAHRKRLVVLHVDHGLRNDSEEDARFVQGIAESLGLDFVSARVTVTAVRGSIEAGARRARYDALERMAHETGVKFVATAHTLDDQAETVLLRAMRGGGLDAIAPVRGVFVRPLLDVSRTELRAWLTGRGIEWREDPTNTDLRFERNWVRRVLLPQMEHRRSGTTRSLATIAERAREDRAVLDAFAADGFARAAVDDLGVFLRADDLDLVPPAIASRVIRSAFRHLDVDPSENVVESVRLREQRRLRCAGVDVWHLDDGIAFLTGTAPAPIGLTERRTVESADWGLRARIGPSSEPRWLWRTALPEGATTIAIRPRRPGDRVPTAVGHKKVQDVLVDAKVPRPLRDLVGILDVDGGPYAVVGYGGSQRPADNSDAVVDVEPFRASWSRERAWMGT